MDKQNTYNRYYAGSKREARVGVSQLEAVFAAVSDAVVICDNEGNMTFANAVARQWFGFGAVDLAELSRTGFLFHHLLRHEDGRPVGYESSPVHSLLRGETLTEAVASDLMFFAPDGQNAYLTINGTIMRDDAGKIDRVLLMIVKRSRQRTVEDGRLAVRENTETDRVGVLLGATDHELRTPLTAIKANVQLALRRMRALLHKPGVSAVEVTDRIGLTYSMLERAEQQIGVLSRQIYNLTDSAQIQTISYSLADHREKRSQYRSPYIPESMQEKPGTEAV